MVSHPMQTEVEVTQEDELREGDRVQIVEHPSWLADMMRLAKSGRVGIVDRIFTPIGGSPVVRVLFPKEGRYKERIAFMAPRDIRAATLSKEGK